MILHIICSLIIDPLLIILAFAAVLNADDKVTLMGAPLFESCPLMLMTKDDLFKPLGLETEFIPWQNPDQYRAMLTSGRADFVVVSILELIRIGQKLAGIRRIFTVESSSLWLLGHTPVAGLADLRGKTLALPFRGDTLKIMPPMLLSAGNGLGHISIIACTHLDMPTLYGCVPLCLFFVWSGELVIRKLLVRWTHG